MAKRNSELEYIEFNGRNSLDFNIGIISRTGILGSAERDVASLSIPGRDGDFIVDNGRYKNVSISFESYIVPDSPQFKDEYELFKLCQYIKDWLVVIGYYKLRSSKQPGYYRLARLSNKLDISDVYFQVGKCTLNFDCYPYMYSDAGDIEVVLNNGQNQELFNNEDVESKPIIHVVGNGSVTITLNEEQYIVNDIVDEIYVDSEREIVYSNNGIEYGKLQATKFPVLAVGENRILTNFDQNINSVTIMPKWRSK